MKFKKDKIKEEYEQFKQTASDSGIAPKIIEHAEKWVNLMEQHPGELSAQQMYEYGQETADWENDIEYDYAVQIITKYWINGKEFKKKLEQYEIELQNKPTNEPQIINED